jgi:TRAP-type transport system small permease protein
VKIQQVLVWFCAAVCALALFAIMVLTFLDVSGRKFLDASIPGSLEITEMLMVGVIFASLPLVSLRAEHVTFDSLDNALPPWAKRFQAIFVNLLCVALFASLGWLMLQAGFKFADQGDQSAQLAIPKAPFLYAMAVFCWLCALVHARLLANKVLDQNSEAQTGEGTVL